MPDKFKEKILEVVRGIPEGETLSYKRVGVFYPHRPCNKAMESGLRKNYNKSMNNINKKLLIGGILAAVLVVSAAGYWYYQYYQKSHKVTGADAIQQAGNAAEDLGKNASQGVLPSLGTNPLENQPDINPASQANPFKNIKTNPF